MPMPYEPEKPEIIYNVREGIVDHTFMSLINYETMLKFQDKQKGDDRSDDPMRRGLTDLLVFYSKLTGYDPRK
jgi:hypothetical protein